MFKFDIDKSINMILFFYENTDKETFAKTKVLKLMFYSDFRHVKEFGKPITGDTYYHLPHGPVPTMTKDFLDILSCDCNNETELNKGTIKKLRETIQIKKEPVTDYNKFKIVGNKKCDLTYFSKSEIEIMGRVAKEFFNTSGTRLSELTHNELAWKNTSENEQIDYIFAFDPEEDKGKIEYFKFWEKEYAELKFILSNA